MKNNFALYPNPVKEVLYFSEDLENITIYNGEGKLVLKNEQNMNTMNLSDLPKGIYLLSGENKTGYKVFKKIVKE
ncbi:T9SS type A sorting domain-containing protein [Flavobacterium covae]|uniref:T9SS type A sorting domain-containing protein n=1 Tax=Flavobacterium covae TaxID=2906076 RepID=UPI003AACF9A7